MDFCTQYESQFWKRKTFGYLRMLFSPLANGGLWGRFFLLNFRCDTNHTYTFSIDEKVSKNYSL
jgi:hypothetical protein